MINVEGRYHCSVDEGFVLGDANTLDLATVFGMGFAPFHGGLLRYGEARGLTEIVDRLNTLTKSPDVAGRPGGKLRFTPAGILAMAAAGDGRLR